MRRSEDGVRAECRVCGVALSLRETSRTFGGVNQGRSHGSSSRGLMHDIMQHQDILL